MSEAVFQDVRVMGKKFEGPRLFSTTCGFENCSFENCEMFYSIQGSAIRRRFSQEVEGSNGYLCSRPFNLRRVTEGKTAWVASPRSQRSDFIELLALILAGVEG
jgi:hypothetical protein